MHREREREKWVVVSSRKSNTSFKTTVKCICLSKTFFCNYKSKCSYHTTYHTDVPLVCNTAPRCLQNLSFQVFMVNVSFLQQIFKWFVKWKPVVKDATKVKEEAQTATAKSILPLVFSLKIIIPAIYLRQVSMARIQQITSGDYLSIDEQSSAHKKNS